MKRLLYAVLAAVTLATACDRQRPVTYKQPPAGSYTTGTRQVKIDDSVFPVDGASFTSEFFKAVGVPPLLGRYFVDEERKPQASSVVVLSYAIWKERFDGAPEIIGRQLEIDGHS